MEFKRPCLPPEIFDAAFMFLVVRASVLVIAKTEQLQNNEDREVQDARSTKNELHKETEERILAKAFGQSAAANLMCEVSAVLASNREQPGR